MAALYLGVDRNMQGVKTAGTAGVASGTVSTGKEIQIVISNSSTITRADVNREVARILAWLNSMKENSLLY